MRRYPRRPLTNKQLAAIDLLNERKYSAQQIAQWIGVNRTTLYRWMWKHEKAKASTNTDNR